MYIFGGRDAVSHFSDVFEFHFETLSWKRASADGITPRFFAAAVADDEYLFVFGGKNIHNFPYNELYKYNLGEHFSYSVKMLAQAKAQSSQAKRICIRTQKKKNHAVVSRDFL
jgi:hypothetical protein